jgi:hypothetical protein
MRVSLIVVIAIAGLLGACSKDMKPASILGGECHIFHPPGYIVKGKTRFDNVWIEDTTEAGITGCGWERPHKRPMVAKGKRRSHHLVVPTPRARPTIDQPVTPLTPGATPHKRWQSIRDRIRWRHPTTTRT